MPDATAPAAPPATRLAYGAGVTTQTADGVVLDCRFPVLGLGPRPAAATGATAAGALEGHDEIRGTHTHVIQMEIDLDAAPASTADVWLRLHLLSHRNVAPHGVNLDGLFGLLTNVVWTSRGPCAVEGFEVVRIGLLASGPVTVFGVDKFPRMADYVVPTGVRIADADRVRLGAHLAEGTTVMHEGFVNFNAGTLGTAMVEGRISAGVVVGANTDIGGSASIIGTLSGGGKEVISVGERCLLSANSGLGISLGDDCVIAAGCYITAGTKVTTPDGDVVKALELSGRSNMLFLTDSVTGTVMVKPNKAEWGGLNSALHAN